MLSKHWKDSDSISKQVSCSDIITELMLKILPDGYRKKSTLRYSHYVSILFRHNKLTPIYATYWAYRGSIEIEIVRKSMFNLSDPDSISDMRKFVVGEICNWSTEHERL